MNRRVEFSEITHELLSTWCSSESTKNEIQLAIDTALKLRTEEEQEELHKVASKMIDLLNHHVLDKKCKQRLERALRKLSAS